MNKFFVRLFVAYTCFAVSLELTNLSRWLRGADTSIKAVRLEPASSNLNFEFDEEQLREIYREYGPAQTRHDRAFFERMEAGDFILFLGATRLSREEDIQWMERMSTDIVFENQPEYIKIFGNRAVVHGRMQGRYNDGRSDKWSYIDVWTNRGDGWHIQSTTSGH